jgi:hypothetical protein
MAANTTYEQGIKWLVSAGGTAVGGGTDARLRRSRALREVTHKGSANLAARKPSTRSWGVEAPGVYLESSDEVTGENLRVAVGGKVVTFDNTTDTFTSVGHGFANATVVRIWTVGGTLPTGASSWTDYHVIATAADTFQVSTTSGGSSVNFTGDGSATLYVGRVLKGVKRANVALTCGVQDIVNTTTGLNRALLPTTRSASLDVEADWYDPAGTGAEALDAWLDEIEASTAGSPCAVFFGAAGGFAFTAQAEEFTAAFPSEDRATVTMRAQSDGAITNLSSGNDTGLQSLFTAILASTAATAVTLLLASSNSGSTQWTGSAYVTSLSVSIPLEERVEYSATFEGSGALTRGATS